MADIDQSQQTPAHAETQGEQAIEAAREKAGDERLLDQREMRHRVKLLSLARTLLWRDEPGARRCLVLREHRDPTALLRLPHLLQIGLGGVPLALEIAAAGK